MLCRQIIFFQKWQGLQSQAQKNIKMKDRKTKQIQKDRFAYESRQQYRKRRDDRPHHQRNFPIRKKTYQQQVKQINHAQTCPFLVRIFYAINDENIYKGKSTAEQLPMEREVKLHMWMDTTLKEISQLIKAILPNVRAKQKFTFWKVTFSKEKKQYEKEQLGWIYANKRYQKGEEKALCQTKFKIGDMIDVSITYK